MTKESLNLAEIKSLLLEMMVDVDSFCRKNNINYSLNYGSLLGAIRHKGFIPWDDDIDLMMSRNDYDKFLSLYDSERYKVLSIERDKDWCYPLFARISDSHTELIFDGASKSAHGLWIAIIVVDNMPHPNPYYMDWDKFRYKIKFWLDLIDFKVKYTTFGKSIIKNVIKAVAYIPASLIPAKQIAIRVEAERTRFNKTKTTFVSEWLGGGRSYGFPAFFMDDFIDVDFEQYRFMAIKEYDCYLKIVYGDYMTLPPIEKQVPLHNYQVFLIK